MTKRVYGQYCGFARALELVGERWAFMIVRDLMVGPKRFSEIRRGLPGIPSNILTERLTELEEAGLVRRRLLERPARGTVYELTEQGAALEVAVVELGRWGARFMGDPRPGETITEDSVATALRSTFRPDGAGTSPVSYLLRMGEIQVHANVQNGRVSVGRGPIPDPDLVIEIGPALKLLLARDITPAQALQDGLARVTGSPQLLDRFVETFHI